MCKTPWNTCCDHYGIWQKEPNSQILFSYFIQCGRCEKVRLLACVYACLLTPQLCHITSWHLSQIELLGEGPLLARLSLPRLLPPTASLSGFHREFMQISCYLWNRTGSHSASKPFVSTFSFFLLLPHLNATFQKLQVNYYTACRNVRKHFV